MELYEARNNVGARVSYHPAPGIVEHGTIKSVNNYFVHVLYDGDIHAKATSADSLLLEGDIDGIL